MALVNVRPFNHEEGRRDRRGQHTYDTITRLLNAGQRARGAARNLYLGFYTTMGNLSAHPALVAVSPQAPVTDWFTETIFPQRRSAPEASFLSGFGIQGRPNAQAGA
jgi:hypothetical protein